MRLKGHRYVTIALLALGISACCPPDKTYPTESWLVGFNDPVRCRQEAAIQTSLALRDFRQDGRGCDAHCGPRCEGHLQFAVDWDCVPNNDPNIAGLHKGYYNVDTTCVCSEPESEED